MFLRKLKAIFEPSIKSQQVARPSWNTAYGEQANEADIYYCFRLILGRTPSKEEWAGHKSALIGKPLKEVMLSYLTSTEFKARNLSIVDHDDIQVVDLPNYRIYVPINDPQVGSSVFKNRSYEPHITRFFEQTIKPGNCVIDIGANIGYFTLCAAFLTGPEGKVYSFEPYSENVKLLYLSQQLNSFKNIIIFPIAVAAKEGLCLFDNSGSNGFIRDIEPQLNRVLNSTPVYMTTLDNSLPPEQKVDLIKIDTEGAEFLALKGGAELLRKHLPIIVSEFSPEALEATSGVSAENYLDMFLNIEDYQLYAFREGDLIACGRDKKAVLKIFEDSGVEHIDIVISPFSH